MTKNRMTEAAVRQRQKAPIKHGVYSIRNHGEAGMDGPQRSLHAELQEQLSDREGVLTVLREQAANSIIICRVASDYIAKQHKKGVPLGEIPLLRAIPAFQNSAARLLAQLLATMPNERGLLDIGEEIAKAVEEHESDS